MTELYHAGLDVGSLTCDAVVLDEEGRVLSSVVVPTGARTRAAAAAVLATALGQAGVCRDELSTLTATGYGRGNVEGATGTVTEITCHARGALHLLPETTTVVDVGGQDSKAIRVGVDGKVLDFAMNDKCAAGTGRFFEVVARALEMDLDDLGAAALKSSVALRLNATCTVFAESEIVGLVARGAAVADLASAVCRSAAERVALLARRVGVDGRVTLTGGVAWNAGFVAALEAELGIPVTVPDNPQIVGALGAALLGAGR